LVYCTKKNLATLQGVGQERIIGNGLEEEERKIRR
jgi:hypothetical protein